MAVLYSVLPEPNLPNLRVSPLMNAEAVAMRGNFGIDEPGYVFLIRRFIDFITFDLGYSADGNAINDLILSHLGPTLVIASILGIALLLLRHYGGDHLAWLGTFLISGELLVEITFGIRGIGLLVFEAVFEEDQWLLITATFVLSVVLLGLRLVVDLIDRQPVVHRTIDKIMDQVGWAATSLFRGVLVIIDRATLPPQGDTLRRRPDPLSSSKRRRRRLALARPFHPPQVLPYRLMRRR